MEKKELNENWVKIREGYVYLFKPFYGKSLKILNRDNDRLYNFDENSNSYSKLAIPANRCHIRYGIYDDKKQIFEFTAKDDAKHLLVINENRNYGDIPMEINVPDKGLYQESLRVPYEKKIQFTIYHINHVVDLTDLSIDDL